jgi:hypothetical protein
MKNQIQNTAGIFLCVAGVYEYKFPFTIDRQNVLHFVDKKQNGSVYLGFDGYPIENINTADGDCVVVKNGTLKAASCDTPAYFACEYK